MSRPFTPTTVCTTVAAFVLLFGGNAQAQERSDSFANLRQAIKIGDTIVVTDVNGRHLHGLLVDISDASLVINAISTSERTQAQSMSMNHLAIETISRIDVERRDSVLNGILIGAGIGASPWLAFTAARAHGSDPPGRGDVVGGALLFGGIGAAIGWLVDGAIMARTTVYKKESHAASRVQMSVLLSRSHVSGRVSIVLRQ